MSKRTRHGKSSEPDQTETASVLETAPVLTRQKRKKKERTLLASAPPATPCATLFSIFPIIRSVRILDQPRFPEISSLPFIFFIIIFRFNRQPLGSFDITRLSSLNLSESRYHKKNY
jgi:hypothetical protein